MGHYTELYAVNRTAASALPELEGPWQRAEARLPKLSSESAMGWRCVVSGVEVHSTKRQMSKECGLKHDCVDAVFARRMAAARGWARIPKPRMAKGTL
ncbi:hypothetical protein D3C71_1629060 [compost metagenome]